MSTTVFEGGKEKVCPEARERKHAVVSIWPTPEIPADPQIPWFRSIGSGGGLIREMCNTTLV